MSRPCDFMNNRPSPYACPRVHTMLRLTYLPAFITTVFRGEHSVILLQAQASEKLAHRFCSHPALEAKDKDIEGRDHEADAPPVAVVRFPQPRLRVAISAVHRLSQTMHAALREPGLTGNLSNTSLGVVTKRVENLATFGPKSHVGLSSAG